MDINEVRATKKLLDEIREEVRSELVAVVKSDNKLGITVSGVALSYSDCFSSHVLKYVITINSVDYKQDVMVTNLDNCRDIVRGKVVELVTDVITSNLNIEVEKAVYAEKR